MGENQGESVNIRRQESEVILLARFCICHLTFLFLIRNVGNLQNAPTL